MTTRVEVGQPPRRLIFTDVQRGSDDEIDGVTVSAELENLRAGREVYLYGADHLTGFFAGLAEHWRGWDGTRAYESIEHDLLLDATHTGSHIELCFTLQDPFSNSEWSVRGKLTLDAGEELSRASEDLKELFAPPQQPGR